MVKHVQEVGLIKKATLLEKHSALVDSLKLKTGELVLEELSHFIRDLSAFAQIQQVEQCLIHDKEGELFEDALKR